MVTIIIKEKHEHKIYKNANHYKIKLQQWRLAFNNKKYALFNLYNYGYSHLNVINDNPPRTTNTPNKIPI